MIAWWSRLGCLTRAFLVWLSVAVLFLGSAKLGLIDLRGHERSREFDRAKCLREVGKRYGDSEDDQASVASICARLEADAIYGD
jgi:hypothetical protein